MSLKEVKVHLSTLPVRPHSHSTSELSNVPRKKSRISLPEKTSVPPNTGIPSDKNALKKYAPNTTEYVYVNQAYMGSVNSMNSMNQTTVVTPPTSVIREQYWACTKWTHFQKVLAVTVGVLMGAVIGLAITLIFNKINEDQISFFSV